ncbi:isochorismatase family protein [Candidatus Uhrbacteria bacterium]|nr:isochorismatase family protein [Candidatus Uhrbacteria bacterium]
MTPTERAVIERLFPVTPTPYTIRPGGNVGLVIVDAVQGFTRFGNLADPEHMVPMVGRVAQAYRRLKDELEERLSVLVFLDTHEADIPEPPYPPHGIQGSDEEILDPDLRFLAGEPNLTTIKKDCVNGFVGAINRHTSGNPLYQWILQWGITTILVAGAGTDIGVSDFVLTLLSARNHGLLNRYRMHSQRAEYIAAIKGMDIVVLTGACETFHAPTAGHDREAWHHAGLALMQSRGAILASHVTGA